MEEKHVGTKGKSPKQGLTNAKDLPMMRCEYMYIHNVQMNLPLLGKVTI